MVPRTSNRLFATLVASAVLAVTVVTGSPAAAETSKHGVDTFQLDVTRSAALEAGDPLGDAEDFGDMAGKQLNGGIVGMSATTTGNGYWLLGADGGVFSFGDAQFYGSTGAIKLNKPVVGMASTPTGNGYWFVASDGGIFAYGDAQFYGSMGGKLLNQPIVGMASTPTGNGYWLVASDGGIFAYGDAQFYGSTGAIKLNKPVVGMSSSPSGAGYWFVASDGGIFAYGDAGFFGSAGSTKLNQPVTAMATTKTGKGYWLTASDGGIFAYGDATYRGSGGGHGPIKSLVRTPSGDGYWFAASDGAVLWQHFPTVHMPVSGETPPSSTTYGFIDKDRFGNPPRWNSCDGAIHYTISTHLLPNGGEQLIQDAVRSIAGATGFVFTYDGLTSAKVDIEKSSPRTINIGFQSDTESNQLEGAGGMTRVEYVQNAAGRYVIEDAQIAIKDYTKTYSATVAAVAHRALLIHELGHAFGLQHPSVTDQAMSAVTSSVDYQGGDLQGLAWVSSFRGCQ